MYMKIALKAYAKLNLTLDVLFKRCDGYHELSSVMLSIDVYDTVCVEAAADDHVSVTSNAELPCDNTAYKAAVAYGRGAKIHIEKRIPSQAGMGGASADAAAVLYAMQRLYGDKSREELPEIAKRVGADVPFCLTGGCALAEGIGEKLTPLPVPELCLLVAKGKAGVSTAGLFKSLKLPVNHPDTFGAISAIKRKDVIGLASRVCNGLETAACALVPGIRELVSRMKAAGALGAAMTGSGSAVFGIFGDMKAAEAAKAEFSDCEFVKLCRSVSAGVELIG